MAEPSSFSNGNSVRKPSGHFLENSSDQSSDHGHRRGYSEVYNPSRLKSYSSQQRYQVSSFQFRDRRTVSWDLSCDPDLRRKKRLATYKVFTLQGKVKSTVTKSFRWVKGKCQEMVYGFK